MGKTNKEDSTIEDDREDHEKMPNIEHEDVQNRNRLNGSKHRVQRTQVHQHPQYPNTNDRDYMQQATNEQHAKQFYTKVLYNTRNEVNAHTRI